MEHWWKSDLENQIEDLKRMQAARTKPIRYSLERIHAMSDDEIMLILSGETDIEGTLYPDTLHLLSTELTRREVKRSRKPHWTTVPAFIFSAIAAIASLLALL